MSLASDIDGFFSGIVTEFKALVSNFSASTFGQGLATAGAAVLKEIEALGEQELTNIIAGGAGAAVAAAATGGGEAVVLAAAAAAIKTQAAGIQVQLTTAALTTLAAHVTTSVLTANAAPVAPVAPAPVSAVVKAHP